MVYSRSAVSMCAESTCFVTIVSELLTLENMFMINIKMKMSTQCREYGTFVSIRYRYFIHFYLQCFCPVKQMFNILNIQISLFYLTDWQTDIWTKPLHNPASCMCARLKIGDWGNDVHCIVLDTRSASKRILLCKEATSWFTSLMSFCMMQGIQIHPLHKQDKKAKYYSSILCVLCHITFVMYNTNRSVLPDTSQMWWGKVHIKWISGKTLRIAYEYTN